VWLTASAVVVHILMWFMFAMFVDLRERTGPAEYPLASQQGARLPSGPRLQAKPANEIYDFHRQESAVLDGYSWIDRGAGTVRIPISEAMRLTLERGLPSRPADATIPQGDASALVPTDASAGRQMERRRQ
jgi:hypothetical protein